MHVSYYKISGAPAVKFQMHEAAVISDTCVQVISTNRSSMADVTL